MNLSISAIPTKITIKLNGTLKDFLDFIQGIYILGPKLVNGKACWIQEGGSVALWYNKYNGIGNWNIGDLEDIGSNEVGLYCLDESNVPLKLLLGFIKMMMNGRKQLIFLFFQLKVLYIISIQSISHFSYF